MILKTEQYIALVISLVLFASCINSQNGSLNGHWEGNLTAGSQTINISLDFTGNEGYFDIPQMGLYCQPLLNIENDDGEISMEVNDRETFDITGMIKGNSIYASVEGDNEIILNVHRKSNIPVRYKEEEVSYLSGDILLSGTIIHPDSPGPHPAIVFIHGSDKMTRETMQNRAYLFVKNGCTALIYDRQGRGKSEGMSDNILPMNVLANDALAGVEFLYSRADIRRDMIGVYGLSQGGWVAPLCASLSDKIAFMIAISAPGINPDKQNSFVVSNMLGNRLRDIFEKSKMPHNEIENIVSNVIDNHKNFEDKIVKDKQIETVPGFSFFEPLPVWEKIKIPVLAVWGEKDEIVPAGESREIIEKALEKGGNKDFTLKVFENANHSIKLAGNNNKFAGRWEVLAPGSNELIINWLMERIRN